MLLDVLQEHLEEIEILWSRRRTAVGSAELDLLGLGALEDRLGAHLDGLTLDGEGPQEAVNRLGRQGPDGAFAIAAALLSTRSTDAWRTVVDGLVAATPGARRGIVEALGHLPLAPEARLSLESELRARPGPLAAPAAEVLSFHRCLEVEAIEPLVAAREAVTRHAAATAIARVGGPPEWLGRLAEDTDRAVRDAALRAAARRGLPWTLERVRAICRDESRVTAASLHLLACLGEPADFATLRSRALGGAFGEAASDGLATLGTAAAAGVVLDLIDHPALTRAAGAALARITGWGIPAFEVGPVSPAVEDATFEDLRPVPDGRAVRALWRERAGELEAAPRLRRGRPLVTESWKASPHMGDLLTRREELTRLWMSEPGLFPELELDAPAARQRAATR